MRIAVIPARGGSKRIPRKNIRVFNGRPMIAWSIQAAQQAGVFEKILVSTEDDEIASLARDLGAITPFVRPEHLSDDHAGTTAVMQHATQWAIGEDLPLDAVCCIYATAPFIRSEDIRAGLNALESGDWDFAFTATHYAASIYRSFRRTREGGIEMLFPEHFEDRSQDLPEVLHDAGQFYWGRPPAWIQAKRVFDRRSIPIVIPGWRVHDIDTLDDWARAELLAEAIHLRFGAERPPVSTA